MDMMMALRAHARGGRDRTPVIRAHEVSGTVARLGGGATGVAPGDEVCGLIGFDRDGAAAQHVTVPAAELAARSGSVPHVAAATLPLTAWQPLADYAALEAGERVLVHGGAGGIGGAMPERSYTVMRPGGRLVTLGGPPAGDQARVHGVGAMFFVVTPDPGELGQLAGLVDTGSPRPVVSQVYPLSEGRRAFESRSQPRPPGKTVL